MNVYSLFLILTLLFTGIVIEACSARSYLHYIDDKISLYNITYSLEPSQQLDTRKVEKALIYLSGYQSNLIYHHPDISKTYEIKFSDIDVSHLIDKNYSPVLNLNVGYDDNLRTDPACKNKGNGVEYRIFIQAPGLEKKEYEKAILQKKDKMKTVSVGMFLEPGMSPINIWLSVNSQGNNACDFFYWINPSIVRGKITRNPL